VSRTRQIQSAQGALLEYAQVCQSNSEFEHSVDRRTESISPSN
jgi:hypothetical protein